MISRPNLQYSDWMEFTIWNRVRETANHLSVCVELSTVHRAHGAKGAECMECIVHGAQCIGCTLYRVHGALDAQCTVYGA